MGMKEDAMNNGQTKPGYNLQIRRDQFILNYALFPNPTDTLTYIPFMYYFAARYGHLASTEVADSGYGSEENYRFMEENGIEAYVKYNMFHKEQRMHYAPVRFRRTASSTMPNKTIMYARWGSTWNALSTSATSLQMDTRRKAQGTEHKTAKDARLEELVSGQKATES